MNTEKFNKISSFTIALFLLACIVYIFWWLIAFLLKFPTLFLSASTDIKVSLIGLFGTAFVSILTIVISKHIEKETDFRRAQYQSKLATYQNFLDNVIAKTLLENEKMKNKAHPKTNETEEDQLLKAMKDFIKDVMLWGSDEVVHSASLWLNHLRKQENSVQEILPLVCELEELIKIIRKDLGHSNRKICKGDILRLFIKDYDETIGDENTKNSASQ